MSTQAQRKYEATLSIVNKVYDSVPAFTDVFDEETWYIFAGCFTVGTILLTLIASRFITLKPVDWFEVHNNHDQA